MCFSVHAIYSNTQHTQKGQRKKERENEREQEQVKWARKHFFFGMNVCYTRSHNIYHICSCEIEVIPIVFERVDFFFVLFCIFLQSTRKLRCFRIAHIIPWNTVGFWHGFAFSHLSFYTLWKWLTRFVPYAYIQVLLQYKTKERKKEKNVQSQLRLSWKSIHTIRNEISQITENSTIDSPA